MATSTKIGNFRLRLPDRTHNLPSRQPKIASQFVELMGRSNFSFLQGASHPEEMVKEAILHGYDGIAICDTNGLYGVVRGYQAVHSTSHFSAQVKAKEKFKYLIGSEVTLVDETHIVLIPLNKLGYSHLCRLLTLGKRQSAKGFCKISFEDLSEFNEGLLCFALPPCNEERFLKFEQVFQDRLYIPVWRDLTWESRVFCKEAFELEKNLGAQLFVTQRPFMHSPERKPLFDVLTCIYHKQTLEKAHALLIHNAERTLRNMSALSALWQDRLDLVEKTVEIAARVDFSLSEIRYKYPRSYLPEGLSAAEFLKKLTAEGSEKRYPQGVPPKIQNTIQYELDLIIELEYEDYFLTLYEICRFADSQGILYQGRGSAANSVVCFCLGLTSVNPEDIDLLFERFISRERNEPPDIDIDFEHSRREEVIQYIYRRYTKEHAAMVCTVIRYRSRMALRDVAKVLEFPQDMVQKLVHLMGREGLSRLTEEASAAFGVSSEKWKMFLALVQELKGFPRHLGIHTGGFVIAQDPISDLVPVESATKDQRYVVQWNKDDVSALKLMKIDILSLGMLTCLRQCFELLKKHKNKTLTLATIPPQDQATYDMISEGDTLGVFQIESRAQIQTLPRMRPQNFYDLVIEVALVRPGPLQGGMVHPFLKYRQKQAKPPAIHPLLQGILGKTHGVPIFQEQVMKIVIAAAKFSPGEADELRRIMSAAWRTPGTMESVRQRIIEGFAANNFSQEFAEKTYKSIEGFASYGFPESHAASFALLTYASSFLKKHHPDIFTCALLNSQPMGFYAPRTLLADAQRNGVRLEPLCIQKSDYDYTLEDNEEPFLRIRTGLRSLYGVPEGFLKNLVQERAKAGLFLDLQDFIKRTQAPRVLLLKLAAAGALECFEIPVRDLIWKIEGLQLDQNSFLWGLAKEQFELGSKNSELIPYESQWEELQREYDTKGFSVSAHPLSILRSYLDLKNQTLVAQKFVPFFRSRDLKLKKSKSKVRVAGLLAVTQKPPTAKGMCFLTLEDEDGLLNIVIEPPVYEKYRLTVYTRSLLEIQGELEFNGPVINVKASKILPLS